MNQYEWPGYLIVLVATFILTAGPLASFFPRRVKTLILMAFVVRAVGVLLRYWVIYDFYEGGDATGYYLQGLLYAEFIKKFDFSFIQLAYDQYMRWWGTSAVSMISGFVLSVIGPTRRGEFLVFSILSLTGVLLFCKAFERSFPTADLRKYARWILLWPSIWFWTSSVSKDAVILFGTGLAVFGYIGTGKNIRWTPMVLGLVITSWIRPHVAGVIVVSIAIAHWVQPKTKWNLVHVLQGLGIIVLSTIVIRYGFANLGFKDIDVENIREYVELISAHSKQGGSAMNAPGLTLTGIPMAFINTLFRPFPTEVSHPLMAAACLELIILWSVVIVKRQQILQLFSEWRSHRLLRLAIPLITLYVLMLGLAVSNLGIIARQRIHILPLLFIFLEAVPHHVAVKKKLQPVTRTVMIQRYAQPAKSFLTKGPEGA